MAKQKKPPYDFGGLAKEIEANETKNQETISTSIQSILQNKPPLPVEEKDNIAVESTDILSTNKKDDVSLLNEPTVPQELPEDITESSKKRPPGRPRGSKKKVSDASLNGNPLNSLLKQNDEKAAASIYLEQTKMNIIEDWCSRHNVSRNALLCFLIDYGLKQLLLTEEKTD